MKVTGYSQSYINQTYSKPTHTDRSVDQEGLKKDNNNKAPESADSITLSQTTLDRQKIDRNMDADQQDRQQHIAAIKEQVESGQYNVHADQVAEKMVGFYMDDLA